MASSGGVRAAEGGPRSALKVGFAERDITPALGLEQPGGYGKSFHTAFHDACKVRAAVFADGQSQVALVGVDALMLPRRLVERARARIEETSGIPSSAILISASHSHSSGPTGMVQPGEYDHASPEVQALAYQRSSCANAEYLELVQARIVDAVAQAAAAAAPARCGFGIGREDQVAFNRRLRMRNGQTWSHPGKGNPETLGYAGPIDPDVGVIGAWDSTGRLLGCVVNFSCHATTNPGGISANWIYYLEKTIRGALDFQGPVVFMQGACGDVTQVDNLSRFENPAPEAWCQLVGGRVGAEAVKVLLTVPRGDTETVAAKSTVLEMKRRRPSPERVGAAWALLRSEKANTNSTEWTFAKETVLLDALAHEKPMVEVEVQAVQVGPAVFIANPAEYFVQFGLDLKKGSPFSFTFPVELANGCVGYVPTEEAFSASGGGYETRLTSYSHLEPAAGRLMLEAGLGLARSLKPGPAPERAPAPPFSAPWSYGNVPPETN